MTHRNPPWDFPPKTAPTVADRCPGAIHGVLVLRVLDDLVLCRGRRQGGDAVREVLRKGQVCFRVAGDLEKTMENADVCTFYSGFRVVFIGLM
jgi:hypothetical protein